MAPKNKKRNGFYYFMRELKERELINGRIVSMSNLPNYAHPKWKQLSLAEREPYEEMARQFNKDPTLRGGKLASDGTRVEDNLREEEEAVRLINKMKQDIKRFCNADCTNVEEFIDLASKKLLYFMSFNILCHTDNDEYIPIEIGLIEYSIQLGIHREYTKILYPGRPPTGYAGAAKQLSADKHQIDIYGEQETERDMKAVYNEILKFTNPLDQDEYPPIFCEEGQIEIVKGCLEWLARRTVEGSMFEVWNAAILLLELRAGAGHPLPSETIAIDLLSKSSFNYNSSSRCNFHEEKDNHYCALAYTKCLCYLLSDAVCEQFNVTLTEKHMPSLALEEKQYTITEYRETSRNNYRNDIHDVRLDRTQNYYQNTNNYEDDYQSLNSRVEPPKPRQPASTCIAEEMNRLRLNMTPATVPGLGLGRGMRRPQ